MMGKAALWSLAAATLCAPLVYYTLLATKSRQTVSQHLPEHAKKQGTPTMGGIIVLIGLIAGCLAIGSKESYAVLLLVGGFGIIGFVDDFVVPRYWEGKRGLGWKQKLIMQILSGVGACWFAGVTDVWQISATTFIILFFSNAYNFADGLDTLAGGIGLIWCLGLAAFIAVSGLAAVPTGAAIMVALGVAFIPFLILNAPPAKVFMGDVGALPIGAVMGWCFAGTFFNFGAYFNTTAAGIAGMIAFSLIMIVELLPVPLQIASVKILKRRMFNFKTPVHHGIQDMGWPETRIAWLFHMVQLGLIVIAIGVAA